MKFLFKGGNQFGKKSKGKKRQPLSENHKKKLKEAKERNPVRYWKGKKFSEAHKQKLKENHADFSGEKHPLWGTHPTEETRQKLIKSHLGQANWQRGKRYFSEEHYIYPVDWSETLRRSIRERDKYVCKICGKQQGDKVHAVHHIDYNKQNCNPKNLITLCIRCHLKTNTVFNRDYWINYFKTKT